MHPICCCSSLQLAVTQAEVWPLLTEMRFVFKICCWGIAFTMSVWSNSSNLQTVRLIWHEVLNWLALKKMLPKADGLQKRLSGRCCRHLTTACKCVAELVFTLFVWAPELMLMHVTVRMHVCMEVYICCLCTSMNVCNSLVFQACCYGFKQLKKSLLTDWPPAGERSPSEGRETRGSWGDRIKEDSTWTRCSSVSITPWW